MSDSVRHAQASNWPPNSDSTDQIQLERFFTYRLNLLSNMLNRQAERFLNQKFGISLPDWRLIAILGRFQEMSVRDLSAFSQMDKALVSRTAARLVKRDLVSSQPHPTDRRLVLLSLTPAGQQMHQAIIPLARARQQKLHDCLPAEEWRVLDQALNKLIGFAETIEKRHRDGNSESLIF